LKNKNNICVVGAGKWGLNHVKTLAELNALGGVVDKDKSTLRLISKKYPYCETFEELNDFIIEKFEGFIIATEPSSHFKLAKQVILQKKPVLVEKPLTLDYKTSKILCDLAEEMNVNLMVGHVLLFHPAFLKMKKLITDGKIGEIQYIYSNRLNLGTFRTNENVFWSFAPHDIALFNYFFNQKPISINSNGIDILQNGIHDSSVTTFKYEGKKMGHIFVSWLHPFKEHRFVIIGSNGMLHFEDSVRGKPLVLYDKKAEIINSIPSPINGKAINIDYNNEKPLTNELKYFISKIDGQKIEVSDGVSGLEVVEILQKASGKL
jgi:UDP-2-acetamido-3-amino-2,3-dideoxy-glucuronate N-acetyltransferase